MIFQVQEIRNILKCFRDSLSVLWNPRKSLFDTSNNKDATSSAKPLSDLWEYFNYWWPVKIEFYNFRIQIKSRLNISLHFFKNTFTLKKVKQQIQNSFSQVKNVSECFEAKMLKLLVWKALRNDKLSAKLSEKMRQGRGEGARKCLGSRCIFDARSFLFHTWKPRFSISSFYSIYAQYSHDLGYMHNA